MQTQSVYKPAHPWAKWIFAVYLLSFFLPVFNAPEVRLLGMRAHLILGYQAFIICAAAVMSPPFIAFFAWLANVFFWTGVWSLRQHRYKRAACCGLVALLLGLGVFLVFATELLVPGGRDSALIGYYVWLASMGLLAMAGWREMSRAHGPVSVEEPTEHERADGLDPGHSASGPACSDIRQP